MYWYSNIYYIFTNLGRMGNYMGYNGISSELINMFTYIYIYIANNVIMPDMNGIYNEKDAFCSLFSNWCVSDWKHTHISFAQWGT